MARPRTSAQQKALRQGAPTDRQVLYTVHEGPQTDFMMSQAQEILYGGAMGGGKSFALRAWGVTYCMVYPGAQIVLFRQKYRELEDTHIQRIQVEVPESIAMYSSGTHSLIFHNGSVYQFRYCERDEDVRTYFTAEYDAILFDEITEFTQYQYVNIITRCRSVKPWWPGRRIRAGGMPLGIGHEWVKNRWVDGVRPNEIWTAPVSEGGLTRQFIPAKFTDNPTLMKTDPDYLEMLNALSPEEYRARALGDWNVSTDQFFTRWRDRVHVVEPFDIPIDWDHFICVDYGFNAPRAVLWFARPPNTQTAFVYKEQYGKGVQLDEQIYLAQQSTDDTGVKPRAVVLDPSMFAKVNVKGDRVRPMADHWREKFANVIAGNNDRIPGWRLMREMLDWTERPDGEMLLPPRLFFFNTCRNTVRTLPLLIVDKNNLEDVNTKGEDHCADALRYGLRHAFEGGSRPGRGQIVRLTNKGIVVTAGKR